MRIVRRREAITTRELDVISYMSLYKMGTYLCREVSMPTKYRGATVKERVDLCSVDTCNVWRFYELKISVSDFRSHNHNTFYGNFNYYITTAEVYNKIQDEIPSHVGCYICNKSALSIYCIKKAKRQELGVDEEKLRFNFMQALSRDNTKRYRAEWHELLDKRTEQRVSLYDLLEC